MRYERRQGNDKFEGNMDTETDIAKAHWHNESGNSAILSVATD